MFASHVLALPSATDSEGSFVDLDVAAGWWIGLLVVISILLLVDLLVVHRESHEIRTREAAIESAVWISIGLAFGLAVWWGFGGGAAGEYYSGYLIEKFEWVLYVFGAFLLFTAGKLVFSDSDHVDPSNSRFLKLVHKVVPLTDELDGQKLFTRVNGKRLGTPLFAVLLLIEMTDVLFAVDSVPAVLAVSHEQFIVFASNAFAILGLRALYFLLADMHARFSYLQQGLAIILAFVGIKMIIHDWYHIPTWLSLLVIALVLAASVGFSIRSSTEPDVIEIPEDMPPPDER
ncbi:MAG: hypothetical protein Q7V62_07130 [Actinomycetota bacterium]|nr:hypothetical protein [Actinomycetota bacterium]